jgi:putative hydroxymethylpyrimidine transport system ATP-binding protein
MPAAVQPITLTVENARLEHAGVALFDRLDLTLPAGRWTCLLGPSGVGKSSLLRLIAGLLPLGAAGRIAAGDGQPLAGRFAYMDQRDLLLPWLSLRDNVALGRRLRGEPAAPERANELLDLVGLGARAGDRPAGLSGGERQRVALARTLMDDRPLVLMDEPFSAVDAITRLELQNLATRLLAGRTVLLVTHDPLEALRVGHRVIVMARDQTLGARLTPAIAPPGTAPRDPAGDVVRRLYGELLERLGAAHDPRTGAAA